MLKERQNLSLSQFAKHICVSRSGAWRIVKRGEIPSVEIGKRILLEANDVERFIRKHTKPALERNSSLVLRAT